MSPLCPRALRAATILCAGLLAAAGLVALAAAPAAAKSGAMPIAHSAKSMGRAGADTAVGADGAAAMIRNPALLLDSYGFRADLTLGFLSGRTRFQNDLNDELDAGGVSVVPSLALAWDPLAPSEQELAADPTLLPDSRLRIGLAVFPLAGGGGESELRTAEFPQGETELTDFFVVAIAPTVAFQVADRLSVGFAPQLLVFSLEKAGLVGGGGSFSSGLVRQHRQADGSPIVPPQPLPPVQGQPVTWGDVVADDDPNASTRIEVESVYGFGIGAVLGFRWQPIDELTIGVSYQTEGWIPRAEGKAKIDANRSIASFEPSFEAILGPIFDTFLPDGGANGFASSYDFEIDDFRTPAVLSLGVAFQPATRWLVAVDFRYVFWKRAFSENDIRLVGGSNDDINEINGSDAIDDTSVQDWRDSFTVALGTSFAATDWLVLRFGYNFGQNPVTEGHATPTTAITEHGLGIGCGIYLDQLELDFAYFHAFAKKFRIDESDDLVEWNDTSFKAEQHWFYLGFGYQF